MDEVVNFLAALYEEGYQYRSLNAYRSAISSVHEKVDGYEVGQHPMVTKGLSIPQPRYTETWNVFHIPGCNENLPVNVLTCKTVMLMALTRPSTYVGQQI